MGDKENDEAGRVGQRFANVEVEPKSKRPTKNLSLDQTSPRMRRKKSLLAEAQLGNAPLSPINSIFSTKQGDFPYARELSETITAKILQLAVIFMALLFNLGILLIGIILGKGGVTIGISPSVIQDAGGVTLELLVLLSNTFTVIALDHGISIYLGGKLTARRGYSMACCGFMQSSPVSRLSFTGELSLNSTCRSFLRRFSYMWLVLEILKILSPIAAIGVMSIEVRDLSSAIDCISFLPSISRDRKWPTMESTMGVSEFIFGNAMGCMRAEHDCGDSSLFLFGPQFEGVLINGDTIVGDGVQMNIKSQCSCYDVNSTSFETNLKSSHKQLVFANMSANLNTLNDKLLTTQIPFLFLFNTVHNESDTQSAQFALAIANLNLCGGYRNNVLEICTIEYSDLKFAKIASTFSTDGTTSSIAITNSEIVPEYATNEVYPISVASIAFERLLTPNQAVLLPSIVPSMLNPLLWWTSADLLSTDTALLNHGMEAMSMILMRAAFQRSLEPKGVFCNRQKTLDNLGIISTNGYSTTSLLVCGALQTVITFVSLCYASTWLFRKDPIKPGIRAVRDPTYFTTLLSNTGFGDSLRGACNAENYVVWQALDVVVRIGESISSIDDIVGHIHMDKPRLVRPLANGRVYAGSTT